MDLILTMVPPGLSLSLSIGIEYAQHRLRKQQIFALKGRLINAAGRMKAVFFDKTGTLTINEMRLHNVILNNVGNKHSNQCSLIDLEHDKEQGQILNQDARNSLLKNFATNHSLSYIKGQIIGDPMETELFCYAQAGIVEDPTGNQEVEPGLKFFKKIRLNDMCATSHSVINMKIESNQIKESEEDLM